MGRRVVVVVGALVGLTALVIVAGRFYAIATEYRPIQGYTEHFDLRGVRFQVHVIHPPAIFQTRTVLRYEEGRGGATSGATVHWQSEVPRRLGGASPVIQEVAVTEREG